MSAAGGYTRVLLICLSSWLVPSCFLALTDLGEEVCKAPCRPDDTTAAYPKRSRQEVLVRGPVNNECSCALRAAWRHKTPPPRPRASSSAQSASTRRLLKRGGARQRTSRSWWMSSEDCTRLLGRLRPVNAASELNRLESQSGPLSHSV